jgi:hypothetical protein
MESLGAQIERTQNPAFKARYGKYIGASNWKIWREAHQLVSGTVVGLLRLYDAVKTKQPQPTKTILEYVALLQTSKCKDCPGQANCNRWLPNPYQCRCGRTYEAVPPADEDSDFADAADELARRRC